MANTKYIHGYSDREALRLYDQADTLDNIIHNDTIFFKGSLILEAGCGVEWFMLMAADPNLSKDL
jgi:hypothetical protein